VKHAVIPDVQAKPGGSVAFLTRIGKYLAEQRPNKIICIGDFADMPSLSSYDRGKKCFEGRRYVKDIDASKRAMDALMTPLAKVRGYTPDLHLTYGNHENRIVRCAEDQPELDGLVDLSHLGYKEHGWKTHEFLAPVFLDGVAYCHYFVSGVKGLPITTAAALLAKKHMSCIAGHQQGRQIAHATRADGSTITGMIVGSCYEHDEAYLGPQGNRHWRGMVMLHEVVEGQFDEMPVSLGYLKRMFR
jgi:hypothetical protein